MQFALYLRRLLSLLVGFFSGSLSSSIFSSTDENDLRWLSLWKYFHTILLLKCFEYAPIQSFLQNCYLGSLEWYKVLSMLFHSYCYFVSFWRKMQTFIRQRCARPLAGTCHWPEEGKVELKYHTNTSSSPRPLLPRPKQPEHWQHWFKCITTASTIFPIKTLLWGRQPILTVISGSSEKWSQTSDHLVWSLSLLV